MRKTSTLLLFLLVITFAFGKPVTMEKASQVANKYLSAYSWKASRSVANSFSKSYNGITTYYVFNYTGGGFVVVSADDAVIPILAESDQGYIESEITNPSTRYWFENYSKEITEIINSGANNTESVAEWNKILNNEVQTSTADVALLLTTTWNQNKNYNYYCPSDAAGSDGKAWVGCVATAMGQIMKYHNFPAKGVGSHSYVHNTYGLQTANFGTTDYNFTSMGNTASSSSYQEIATLLYHAGVSVDMGYGGDESGAFSEDVPWAMSTYFNYDNSTIKQASMSDYTSAAWRTLLKSELDAHRPLYYSGSDPNGGHAWVCDGYSSADNKFHMNWGWSGSANGYYAIGVLNPTGTSYKFNTGNSVIYGIKPGNPDLIVRFTNLDQNNSITSGPVFDINYSVVKGSPVAVKLYINNQLVSTSTQSSSTYSWKTAESPIGTYTIRVEAIDANDTVYQEIYAGLSEWVPQASAFTSPFRYINNIHALDSLVVWATALDNNPVVNTTINEFTKTTNGGKTWTPGQVLGGTAYGLGNICGLDTNIAYVSVYNSVTQDNTCGVYKTSDGGTTWIQLPGALQGAESFADNVWFWNENEGMCHGDVKDTYFEIYTTSNGGVTWTRVPKADIGAGVTAASGEGGWTSVMQAVGDNTVMFGTNKGNLYISHDKGLHWVISKPGISPITSGVQKICFKDEQNGLVAQTSTTTVLKETHDGGTTWQTVTPVGPFKLSDMAFVPGTENTFVSTGAGASYSFDGGHSWSQAGGTEISPFPSVAFVNNHCGWAGGINVSSFENGINKYTGILVPAAVRNPVSEFTAEAVELTASLKWTAPVIAPLSYNIYRNDTLVATGITSPQYLDSPVAKGRQMYCVTAVYEGGESLRNCTSTWIALGVAYTSASTFMVYPNPARGIINIMSPDKFSEVRMISSVGQVVYRNTSKSTNLHILTEGFEPGIYILQIYSGKQVISKKVSIIR